LRLQVGSFNPLQVLPATQIRRQIMSDVYRDDMSAGLKRLIGMYMMSQFMGDGARSNFSADDEVKALVAEAIDEAREEFETLRRKYPTRWPAQQSN
jgi:hypothetical protein